MKKDEMLLTIKEYFFLLQKNIIFDTMNVDEDTEEIFVTYSGDIDELNSLKNQANDAGRGFTLGRQGKGKGFWVD